MSAKVTEMTTIKVPKELRDRLGERARIAGTTLAGAIDLALAASDVEVFWRQVRAENSAGAGEDEFAATNSADDLADARDDEISAADQW